MKTWTTFAAGCLVAGAVAWHASDVKAQAGATAAIHVCGGAGGALRLAPGDICPQNSVSLELLAPGGNYDSFSKSGLDKRVAALESQVKSLAESLAALERSGVGSTTAAGRRVRAPFQVVDDAGKVIFEVNAGPLRGFKLYSASGVAVAFGSALQDAAFFKAVSPDGDSDRSASIGVTDAGQGLTIRHAGSIRAAFMVTNGTAALDLKNASDVNIIELTQGANRGGRLQLGDAAGSVVVDAGAISSGIGVVRAYPLGNPGAGLLGLAGTFIAGRTK